MNKKNIKSFSQIKYLLYHVMQDIPKNCTYSLHSDEILSAANLYPSNPEFYIIEYEFICFAN